MRRHAIKALHHSGRGIGLSIVFAGALVGGVVLHADLAGFRRAAAEIGNRAMAQIFDGRIVVGHVESLSIGSKSRVRAETVDVLDPDGKRVIHAEGVESAIELRSLLKSLWAGTGAAVELDSVRVKDADVVLDRNADGTLNIARAFHRRPSPILAPSTPAPTSVSIHATPYLDISAARIAHAHIHGTIVPTGLDGDATKVALRVHLEHDVVRIDLDDGQASLAAPMLPNQKEPIAGAVKGAISVELATITVSGHGDLTGSVGAVPLVAHAAIDHDEVTASLDVAQVAVEPLGKAFGGLPFGRSVEAHATAHGKLPLIALEARARVGESDVLATGDIDLREGHAYHLEASAGHVDASAYGAPVTTDISAKLHSEGVLGGQGLGVIGTFRVITEDGTAGDEKVPATTIEGHIEEKRITASLRASEPGVDLSGTADLDLATWVLGFDLQARSSSLRRIKRVPNGVDGLASLRAQGSINLPARTIKAATTLHGDAIAFESFSASHIDASGQLHGPLAAPILDLGFQSKNLGVKAKGKTPLVYPAASGHAQIAFVPSIRVVSASIDLGEKGTPNAIGAVAANLSFANGVVEAHGVELTGLGEPLSVDASFGPNGWSLRAKSAGVDLHRVAAMTGITQLEVLPEGTKAALDVDVRDGEGGATGHVDVVVTSEKGALLGGGLVLETHAKIVRGHVAGTARLSSEGLGDVEITDAQLDIPGRLSERSLERATGTIELRGAFDLAQGGAMFLQSDKIESLAGIAAFEARIERGEPDAMPAVRATVHTTGLDVVYSADPSKPSTKVAGIDLSGHIDWDGRTDDAELSFLSWDSHGLLGNAGAKAKVPLTAWITGKQRLDRRAIADLDIDAIFDVPTRKVADLPAFLDLPAVRGTTSAHVGATGPILHPSVVVSARATELRTEQHARRASSGPRGATTFEPLDGVLEARWDGYRGAITFALDERAPQHHGDGPTPPPPRRDPTMTGEEQRRAKRAPGHVHGLVMLADLRMSDLLRGRVPSELPWTATSEIEVQDLNLGALPIPVVQRVTGALTGRFSVKDLNRAASFEATAHVDDFGVGGATVQALDVTANGKDASLFVKGTLKDAESSATAQFDSKSLHVDGLDLSWNAAASSRLDYAVQNVSLALLGPLVRKQISEIGGRVNGAGSVTIEGPSQVFEGGLDVRETTLYVNVIGETISGLAMTAKFDKSGTFSIDNASGKLGVGEFHAKATGQMKGFAFASGQATVTAPPKGAVPISSEGANFASASGEVHIDAKMSAEGSNLILTVELPQDEIILPDRSAQQLQPLEADKTIDIGIRKKNGQLDTNAVRKGRGGTGKTTTDSGLTTQITATLGQKVHLQGRGLDVTLGGKTFVQIAKELSVTGQIDLKSGTIEVHGRRFTVDHGVVTFAEGGDPGNPTVVAAAYWDAPDRTRVWVEFAGPLKSGKLTLRSEPAFSKNEILSILLFGQPDPNMATGGGSSDSTGDASGATAVGSGFVAEDLNRMLSEIDDNLDIETDTLEGNRTRTKIGRTFFDRRLKVQVGYAPGTTYREPDSEYLFLNWQFIPKWALVGTRGDKGTSILDVIFQHRY